MEQLGFRKIIDTTFMMASMITGDPDESDIAKYFAALRSAQRDIDLRPELYTHYYAEEFPPRFREAMDTRRWGPGERLVFETYSREMYDDSFAWIASHGIFPRRRDGRGAVRGSGGVAAGLRTSAGKCGGTHPGKGQRAYLLAKASDFGGSHDD